jgi:hypothetical protein
MMNVFENLHGFSSCIEQSEMLWLCRKTDWMKLLQLPNVSWWQFLFASACLVVAVWGILRLVSRVNEDVDPAEADREMLQRLNELRREGDLTEDEFRSIKSQIVGRLNTSWSVASKSRLAAENADKTILSVDRAELSENISSTGSESNDSRASASQSNQPESFTRPTNVPDPPQDTMHLTEGSMPPESENSQGLTEANPANEFKD